MLMESIHKIKVSQEEYNIIKEFATNVDILVDEPTDFAAVISAIENDVTSIGLYDGSNLEIEIISAEDEVSND